MPAEVEEVERTLISPSMESTRLKPWTTGPRNRGLDVTAIKRGAPVSEPIQTGKAARAGDLIPMKLSSRNDAEERSNRTLSRKWTALGRLDKRVVPLTTSSAVAAVQLWTPYQTKAPPPRINGKDRSLQSVMMNFMFII